MTKTLSFWRTPKGWAALALVGAVIYFLLMEHRAHLFYALPFLIFLLCPIMHIFMHGGHGHGEQQHDEKSSHDHVNVTDSDAYRSGLEEGRKQAHNSDTGDDRR